VPRKGQFKPQCIRGHEKTPDNMYTDRQCKRCAQLRNPEKVARILAKQRANPLAHNARVRDWAATDSGKRSVRNTQLKMKYDITLEEYEQLLASQQGCCAICKDLLDSSRKSLIPSLDHKHDITRKVRGILCGACNMGIAQLKENISILNNAIEYLSR
jgi:Recombination endonuclease VII